jgi:hypothetical protein
MAMSFTPRSVGLIAIAALGFGWLGSSVTHDSVPRQSRSFSGARPIGSSVPVQPRAEKIRERVTQTPLPQRGRNPFVYGSRVSSRPTSFGERTPERETAAIASPAPAQPPPPVIRLSGIAGDVKDGATIYTAILSDNGSIVFAKAGDKLSNGYSVVRVEEMSITIIDANGVTQTIRLP